MAIPAEIVVEIRDEKNKKSTTSIFAPSGGTYLQYSNFGRSFVSFLDNIIAGRIRRAEVCLDVDLTGLSGNVVGPSSDVEEKMSVAGVTAEGRPVNFNIPTLNELQTLPQSDDLDRTDPSVISIENMLLNGVGTANIPITDLDSDPIIGVLYMRESFSNSKRK